MKVLSIKQPWAYLIANGIKDIENRNWKTKFRGDFLIHASKSFDKEGMLFVQSLKLLKNKTPLDFNYGGIVGITTLIDCADTHNSHWFFGKYGFVLENSRPLHFYPFKGRLNFFNIDSDTAIKIIGNSLHNDIKKITGKTHEK